MRSALALVLAVAWSGCASEGPPRTFDNNDLELAVGNAARMTCSCLYVMNMPETYCRAWTLASPQIARWSADPKTKRVEASAFISWTATARFVDEKRGCMLE